MAENNNNSNPETIIEDMEQELQTEAGDRIKVKPVGKKPITPEKG